MYPILASSVQCRAVINGCEPRINCDGTHATCPPESLFDKLPIITAMGTVRDASSTGANEDISYTQSNNL